MPTKNRIKKTENKNWELVKPRAAQNVPFSNFEFFLWDFTITTGKLALWDLKWYLRIMVAFLHFIVAFTKEKFMRKFPLEVSGLF